MNAKLFIALLLVAMMAFAALSVEAGKQDSEICPDESNDEVCKKCCVKNEFENGWLAHGQRLGRVTCVCFSGETPDLKWAN